MKIDAIVKQVGKALQKNSPYILTALGVSGTLSTAYLASKASFRAAHKLADEPDRTRNEKVKLVWKYYIPAAVSGTITIGCVVSASKIGSRRAATAYSLLSLSEKALVEYKEKVTETIGVNKEKKLRDEIAQDKVTQNPVSTREVIITGGGNVLCCELFTGRYFNSDMESIKKAQNEINSQILHHMQASLSDFYSLVGLPFTSRSFDIGWNSDKLLELEFTTTMSDDGRPCIAFDYNYVKAV